MIKHHVLKLLIATIGVLHISCDKKDDKIIPIDSSKLYDLGALPAIVSDIKWPHKPNLTKSISVATNEALQEAAQTNGVTVSVAAGTYESLNITCNDCEFQLENNAVIQGRVTFAGSRIYFGGGQITEGPIDFTGDGDIFINNVHAITNGDLNNFSGTPVWHRVAIINSTFEVQNGELNGSWAFYVQDKVDTDFRGKHLILANVRLESDAQNNRFQAIQNAIIVDSYFNGNQTSTNGLRMHHGLEDVYMRNTVIVGPNTNSGDNTQITNGIFENIIRYDNANTHFSNGIGYNTVNVTINNSQAYTTSVNSVGLAPDLGVATGENPNLEAWDGITVIDPSTVGADH